MAAKKSSRKVVKAAKAVRTAKAAKAARKSPPAKKGRSATRKVPAAKATATRAARQTPETLRLRSIAPSLTVNDLQKSLAFYEGGLGFMISERWTDGDVLRGVMLKAGLTEVGLSQDDWKLGRDRQKGTGFRLWCQTAQPVDAIAARLKAAGYSLTEEPQDHPAWKVRSFSVDDPDGFHLTIAQDL